MLDNSSYAGPSAGELQKDRVFDFGTALSPGAWKGSLPKVLIMFSVVETFGVSGLHSQCVEGRLGLGLVAEFWVGPHCSLFPPLK